MIYQTFISKELRLVKFLIEIWCVSEFLYSNFINLLNLWKAWWIFWNIPLHSFSEELALLTSAAIYNLIWGSFTFLASKVGRPPKIHQKRENLRCQSYSHLELCSTASIWSTSSTRWSFFKFFKIFFFQLQDLFLGFLLPPYVLFRGERLAPMKYFQTTWYHQI